MHRVETGGEPYQEMLDLVCNAVEASFARQEARSALLPPALDPRTHRNYIERVLRADAKNYISATEFVDSHSYFFLHKPEPVEELDTPSPKIQLVRDELLQALRPLSEEPSSQWDHDSLASATDTAIKAMISSATVTIKKKEVWKVLRAMLTGGQKGPSLIESMEILGPEVVMERIQFFDDVTLSPAS
jgi:glutamyl-tRNA synthetase